MSPQIKPVQLDSTANLLMAEFFQRLSQPRFRGDLIENAKRFRLVGPAYKSMPKEQDGYFWIQSARQHTGPLAALHDQEVREVGIIGATQVLKSVAGNVWLPSVMEHDPADTLVLFENDKKAQDFAVRRIMPTLKHHPVLKERIKSETITRHDVTKTKITSSSMSLEIGALNDSDVSTFSYRYIWVSESWQHYNDGMLMKAIKRADRYPDNCKILIESQAGLADGDLHKWTQTAHAVHYEWACPFCDGRQTWECANEFGNLRGADFSGIKPRNAADDWQAPKPGTYSGMKFPAEGTIDERARKATWECHHCGTQIADTKANRLAIAESSTQNYKILENGFLRSPKSVVFFLPKETNADNTFESSAKSYLIAKEASDGGNPIPLINWYLSERAVFFSEKIGRVTFAPVFSTVDPLLAIPNEMFRGMSVDPQKDLLLSAQSPELKQGVTGHFWVVAHAVDKAGNEQQLWRGYCTSWEEWINKAKELKIPAINIVIDGRFKLGDVINRAAANAELMDARDARGNKTGARFYATWTVLRGDTFRSWRHGDGYYRDFSQSKREVVPVEFNGKKVGIEVNIINWSNFRFKNTVLDMLQNSSSLQKIPGRPTLTALPMNAADPKDKTKFLLSEKTRAMEVDTNQHQRTWESQMASNKLGENKKGQVDILEVHDDPHYFDCLCGMTYLKKRFGLLGAIAAPDMSAPEAA